MKSLSCARLTLLIAAAFFAGCANSGQQVPVAGGATGTASSATHHLPPPSDQMIALTTRDGIVPKVHFNHRKSWAHPDAKNTQYLLYVSDEGTGAVNVYAYKSKKGHMVGQATGFQFPYGQCLDSSGNVYVVDFAATQIVEFAHGGTTPIKTLPDSYGYPIGCSVDPTTGNLAVANFESAGSQCMGGIVIYAGAEGSGTSYTDADFMYLWPPAYDPSGNLYVQGQTSAGGSGVAEMLAGSTTLGTLSLSGGTINFPGGMLWDGHYIAATDQQYQGGTTSGLYQLSVSDGTASVVGSVQLTDSACMKGSVAYSDTVQPFLNGTNHPNHAIVGGNLNCSYRYNFWNYIRGGDPKRNLPYDIAPELASGQVVSPMMR
jgi:hypothetical protein